MRAGSSRLRRVCFISSILFAGAAFPAMAAETVITDDGERVRLQDDGTWVILSEDRYATMPDGSRVRLRPDGTWVPMRQDSPTEQAQASAPLAGESQAGTPPVAAGPARAGEARGVSLTLNSVEILRREIQRAKSSHAEVRTVYTLEVTNEGEDALALGDAGVDAFAASSSRGLKMPIETVRTDVATLAPGERGQVRIAALGAPRWFGTKYMSLEVKPGAFGAGPGRILSKNMEDVKRREVDSFE